MKHYWISGIKIDLLKERNQIFNMLNWSDSYKEFVGESPRSYSIHIFENKDNTGGIISLSDAFGGGVCWAGYKGKNTAIGKEQDPFDKNEIDFLKRRFPKFLEAINHIDD